MQRCTAALPDARHGSLMCLTELLVHAARSGSFTGFEATDAAIVRDIGRLISTMGIHLGTSRRRPVNFCTSFCDFVNAIAMLAQKSQIMQVLREGKEDRVTSCISLLAQLLEASNDEITTSSSIALGHFLDEAYQNYPDEKHAFMKKLVLNIRKSPFSMKTRGQFKLLCNLPASFIHAVLEPILRVLASIIPCEDKDIEARKLALDALTSVLSHSVENLSDVRVLTFFDIILSGFLSYDTDYRGEIGSTLRLAAASAATKLLLTCQALERRELVAIVFDKMLQNLLDQLFYRIDNVRMVAFACLTEAFRAVALLSDMKMQLASDLCLSNGLWNFFTSDCKHIEESIYRRFLPHLCDLNQLYFKCVMKGLITSSTSLCVHVSSDAKHMLLSFAMLNDVNFDRVRTVLTELICENRNNYRVVLSVVQTVHFLFFSAKKTPCHEEKFLDEVDIAMARYGKNIYKVLPLIPIFTVILHFEVWAHRRRAISIITPFLRCDIYPRIRVVVADSLKQHFARPLNEQFSDPRNLEVMEILNLPWGSENLQDHEILKKSLDRLCLLLSGKPHDS
mmetsp:Transcript_21032/g.32753  ORF Transcript_21032/g.32753 Transcript_21032/m.32753 type:complete len:565 (-) Transcript_21032:38-1732(-)